MRILFLPYTFSPFFPDTQLCCLSSDGHLTSTISFPLVCFPNLMTPLKTRSTPTSYLSTAFRTTGAQRSSYPKTLTEILWLGVCKLWLVAKYCLWLLGTPRVEHLQQRPHGLQNLAYFLSGFLQREVTNI